MARDNQDTGRGAFLALCVGVVIGVLVAPRSGKETRERIVARSRQSFDNLENRLSDLRSDLAKRIDSLRDLAETVGEEASVQSRAVISKAELLKADLRSSASHLAENTGKARTDAVSDAKRLVRQGGDIMTELERATREIVKNTRAKAHDHAGELADGE